MSSEWPVVRLGDYCLKIGSGATPRGGKSVYLDAGETTLIRSQNIYNDGFTTDGLVYITKSAADKLNNVEVLAGDILLNITGDSVARVCIAPTEYLPARVNQHVSIIRPNPDDFDARFLRYFLVSPEQQELLLVIASSGATRNALTKGHIESLEISKPSLAIQTGIADQLETLDKKIEINQQINQTLEQMAQAIFKSWFVDFEPVKAKMAALEAGGSEDDALLAAMQAIAGNALFASNAADADAATQLARLQAEHPEQYATLRATAELFPAAMQDSELGEIPQGWDASKLCDEFDVTMGQSPPGHTYNEAGDGVPFFQGRRDFGVRYPSNRVYCTEPKRMAKAEDTLLSVRAPVGDTNLARTDCCIGRGIAALRHKSGCSSFTYYSVIQLGQALSSYDSEGTVFGSINQKNLNSLLVITPPKEILNIFSQIVGATDSRIKSLSEEASTLAELRDTLLPKLLSGELSVSAAADQITKAEEAVNVQS